MKEKLVTTALAIKLEQEIDAFKWLSSYMQQELEQVNHTILVNLDNRIPLIQTLAGHLIRAGGKRLRPLLTLASAKLCEYDEGRQIPLAAAIEFLHTATLLHDDVVDDSYLRRGQQSAKAIWGNKASVLVGDFLFARAFELMVADGAIEVLNVLSRASSIIIEGEVLQLKTCNDLSTGEEVYLQVVSAKTAELFAASCHVSGIIAGVSDQKRRALDAYGRNLGMAFQLMDDVIDYASSTQKAGKKIGDDFREGKITLPVILAYRHSSFEEKAFWQRTIVEQEFQENDLSVAINLMNQYKVFEKSRTKASEYVLNACEALHAFNDCELKEILILVAKQCLDRSS